MIKQTRVWLRSFAGSFAVGAAADGAVDQQSTACSYSNLAVSTAYSFDIAAKTAVAAVGCSWMSNQEYPHQHRKI